MKHRIVPSIVCADRARLAEETRAVVAAGADALHFDVMEVDELTRLALDHGEAQALKRHLRRRDGTAAPLEVHLGVAPLDALVERFVEAGADLLSFHADAATDVERTLRLVRVSGCRTGLAFEPAAPLDALERTIGLVDQVLLMSVHPGYGGQAFIEGSLRLLEQARRLVDAERARSGREIRLAVEGGIHAGNIRRAADAGADTFIVGSAVFGRQGRAAATAALRAALAGTAARTPAEAAEADLAPAA